jgi:DNA-binding transcriptional MerR regulator
MMSKTKYLRTSDLARAVGVHANTVRRYIDWELLPPVERSPSGYRLFTQRHLDCLRLARMVYGGEYPGRAIRQAGVQVVHCAADGDLGGALELAYRCLVLIQSERAQAEAAVRLLERWAQGVAVDTTQKPVQIGGAAQLLGVSAEVLRNWERNGLIHVPRNPASGYRCYHAAELGRLRVIRMLSRAGYSLMAILRMLTQLDKGETTNLRQALDTPGADEDVYTAFDHWISTLTGQEQCAHEMIALLESMILRIIPTPR